MNNIESDPLARNIGSEIVENIQRRDPRICAHYAIGERSQRGVVGRVSAGPFDSEREARRGRDVNPVYFQVGDLYLRDGRVYTHGVDDDFVHRPPEVPTPPEWRI